MGIARDVVVEELHERHGGGEIGFVQHRRAVILQRCESASHPFRLWGIDQLDMRQGDLRAVTHERHRGLRGARSDVGAAHHRQMAHVAGQPHRVDADIRSVVRDLHEPSPVDRRVAGDEDHYRGCQRLALHRLPQPRCARGLRRDVRAHLRGSASGERALLDQLLEVGEQSRAGGEVGGERSGKRIVRAIGMGEPLHPRPFRGGVSRGECAHRDIRGGVQSCDLQQECPRGITGELVGPGHADGSRVAEPLGHGHALEIREAVDDPLELVPLVGRAEIARGHRDRYPRRQGSAPEAHGEEGAVLGDARPDERRPARDRLGDVAHRRRLGQSCGMLRCRLLAEVGFERREAGAESGPLFLLLLPASEHLIHPHAEHEDRRQGDEQQHQRILGDGEQGGARDDRCRDADPRQRGTLTDRRQRGSFELGCSPGLHDTGGSRELSRRFGAARRRHRVDAEPRRSDAHL
ncbi:hypothetical protein QE411_000357 [Microbacterium arborescens]|nr:hypothetical protein [Microbacterium arborescens]